MRKLHVDTNAIRADIDRFRQGLDTTLGAEDMLDALFELDWLRAAVVAFLDNDTDENWRAMASIADPAGEWDVDA